jgi:hypothetical protein
VRVVAVKVDARRIVSVAMRRSSDEATPVLSMTTSSG